MKHFTYSICLSLLYCLLTGCSGNRENKKLIADNSEPLPIERLDLFITDYPESFSSLDSLPEPGLALYLAMLGIEEGDTCEILTSLHQSALTTTFGRDVRARFGSTDELEKTLGKMRDKIAKELPEIKFTKIYGIISPYNQSVIVSDSIVFIALNHYMGSDYEGYRGMSVQVRKNKTPERIVSDISEALIRINYPYHPSPDPTLLERMLYEGAVYATLKRILPDRNEEFILGLNDNDYSQLISTKDENWKLLSSTGLLYSTQPDVISDTMTSAPDLSKPSNNIPRKTVQFFGLEIIKDYIDSNPGITSTVLLSPSFYSQSQQRLIESKR